jgi:hypothetical protein
MDENSINDALKPVFEVPHWFTLDLQHWSVINLRISLAGINQEQEEFETNIRKTETDEEVLRSIINSSESYYGELRANAYKMAAVSLVTRLQHHIEYLARHAKVKPDKGQNASRLISLLNALNRFAGEGPISLSFFDGFEELRNSVIHADSNIEWDFQGKTRRVADQYRDSYGQVGISDEQLEEAVDKMVEQVKWYERKIP